MFWLYQKYLFRDPDTDGMEYYYNCVKDSTITLKFLEDIFKSHQTSLTDINNLEELSDLALSENNERRN